MKFPNQAFENSSGEMYSSTIIQNDRDKCSTTS